jgi:hypothetical protein
LTVSLGTAQLTVAIRSSNRGRPLYRHKFQALKRLKYACCVDQHTSSLHHPHHRFPNSTHDSLSPLSPTATTNYIYNYFRLALNFPSSKTIPISFGCLPYSHFVVWNNRQMESQIEPSELSSCLHFGMSFRAVLATPSLVTSTVGCINCT